MTGAAVRIHPVRIEDARLPAAPLITARAVAPLPKLLALAAPLLAPAGTCLFLKGANAEDELTHAATQWHMQVAHSQPHRPERLHPSDHRTQPCPFPNLTSSRPIRRPSAGRGSWQSPTRRVASARRRPPSTWRPRWRPSDETVLLIDLDPQGNASTGLGISRSDRAIGSYRLITDRSAACPGHPSHLDCQPLPDHRRGRPCRCGNRDWSVWIAANTGCATRLPRSAPAPSPYSFVLIDCPPSLGLLTLNGLVAADAVLVPLQCEFYALEGISGLVRTIEMVKRGLNPRPPPARDCAHHVRSTQ